MMRVMAYPPTKEDLERYARNEKLAQEAGDRMVAAGEKALEEMRNPPSLVGKIFNPANWSDKTKARLKKAGVEALRAAIIAGATALGIKSGIASTILDQIFGG